MTDEAEWLAQRFEADRGRVRGVAYRMLGSLSEAEDAVQETWLRLSRTDANGIANLGGWLTTVVSRVCLDALRSRNSRGEQPLDEQALERREHGEGGSDPEQEALLADSVGLALLVVMDALNPAERVAFVLHDMFDLPFEEIALILGRSPVATRQLASRARRRVRGDAAAAGHALKGQRKVVDAFLAALRGGDFEGLLAVLDPDLVVRTDRAPAGAPLEVRGARTWAKGAMAFAQALQFAQPAFVDGALGLVWAPRGRLVRAVRLSIAKGRIVRIDVVADSERVGHLRIGVL
jgi:RNA polymerase sigma-70 factor, ECF subfamily